MKRALTIAGAAGAGFAGVLGLYANTASLSATPPTTTVAPTKSTTPTSSAPPPPSSTTPTTTVAPTPTTTSPTPTSAPAVGASSSRSAVGKHEYYGYGELAVKVTIVGTRIVNLQIASLRTAESYSQQLAQQAIPILKSEVLQAQGTRISSLSGATYTSAAYAYSVQNALDQLHFK